MKTARVCLPVIFLLVFLFVAACAPPLPIWYLDSDGDGYGNRAISLQSGTSPDGYVANPNDCDDSNAAINPAAAEVTDGIDNDCDTLIDESSASNQQPVVSISAPTDGASYIEGDTITLLGEANDAEDGDLSYAIVWRSDLQGALGSGASLSVALPAGTQLVSAEITDSQGAVAIDSITITVTESDLPPDPATVAPPLAETESTSFQAATAFLYTGSNPIQSGVANATIAADRSAVIRGMVQRRDGTPLTNVTVSVNDHPEFGQTLSRADGVFDLVVNGGGNLVINYEKSGYLPAQRVITTEWNEYHWVDDVVLVALDAKATAIDLNASSMQVARGSVVSDADGVRQATVLFPAGVSGSMTMPDNSSVPLSSATVRATEYTVGEHGPEAMPGSLPATSGYTYAVEWSLDEAIAAGAKDVQFSQPLYVYIENFIGFPVGGIVPAGWYDRGKAAWMASDNGRVIEILAINTGLADIDVDGSGIAADATALASLNVTDDERTHLAALYAPGTSLWRVPVTHFTPWDLNWPYGPPDDAEDPDQPDPDTDEEDDDPDCEDGSIIECENAVLRERVPIVGTPFTLNYRSDRVRGRQAAYSMDISLSNDFVPASVQKIVLEIEVAGRRFVQQFAASPNQSYTFVWDGLDAYGREVAGKAMATATVSYVYPAIYKIPSEFEKAFAATGGATLLVPNKSGSSISYVQKSKKALGVYKANAAGLGAWTISSHQFYSQTDSTVHYGNGGFSDYSSEAGLIINTVAGTGGWGSSGDGGPAEEAEIFVPYGVDVGPDGSIYLADNGNSRVRRISPDGIISTFAGTDSYGYNGDGIAASEADLYGPWDVKVAADGSLYIADTLNYRVRKVDSNGIITTIAGTGERGSSGDGGPATQAQLYEPMSLALAADGSIYISDKYRVRRVGPDGIITTVAGNGASASNGDGGAAIEASLDTVEGIALGPDGSLYISERFGARVRKVSSDGIITTVAGTGTSGYNGDAMPATEAQLGMPLGLAVADDGTLYIVDASNHRVRRVSNDGIITTIAGNAVAGYRGDGGPAYLATFDWPAYLALTKNGFYVSDSNNSMIRLISGLASFEREPGTTAMPSADGKQLYVFNLSGRHLRTEDTTTGATLYQFTYNPEGLLSSIEDTYGNTTTIERQPDGTPSAIIAPEGQRTDLILDANGYLATISNPNNESHQMVYTDDGLLTSFSNPRNNTSTISYEADGRLKTDTNAAGGGWTLQRKLIENGREVSMTSKEGRTTRYRVEKLPSGGALQTNTYPDGTTSTSQKLPGSGTRITSTDGTVTIIEQGNDPRFGATVAFAGSKQLITPGGLISTATIERTADLATPGDILSHTQLAETVTVNGRSYSKLFDRASMSYLYTSPEGRQRTIVIDQQGRLAQVDVPGLNSVSYNYDVKGRLSSIVSGDRTTNLTYNSEGYLDTLTDAELQETRYVQYDLAGRVTQQGLSDGESVLYDYDANGNVTGITPPGRAEHAYDYSPVDRLGSYSPPGVADVPDSSTRYEYNLDKKISQVITPLGTITYSYDATTGRKQAVQVPRGTYSFGYSPTSGQLTSIMTPDGDTISMAYDGFLLTRYAWSGDVAGSVDYSYDNNFAVATEKVNGGFSVGYQYDDDKLLTDAGGLSISRNPQNGLITGTSLAGLSTSRSYNGYAELTDYTASYGANPLYSVSYGRDDIGRIIWMEEGIAGVTTRKDYFYDLVGRLEEIKTNDVTTATYTYDANGNRTHVNDVLLASVDEQDRLTQYSTTNYTYNVNGALQSKTDTATSEITNYSHDVFGNLLQVELPGGVTIDYIVDGSNRRIGKLVNGTLQQGYLYKDQLNPVAELDGNNAVVARFVYADKPYVPAYMIKDGVTYRIISDHLGSPRLVVNTNTGDIEQRMDYDAWGNVTNDTNPGFQPFGFAGGLYDQHTGLVKFGARDYDAAIGRWIQRDPIGLKGGLNTYSYVDGNPVNAVDANGEMATNVAGAIGGAIMSGVASLTHQVMNTCGPGDIDWGQVGASVVGGGVAGFITSGASAYTTAETMVMSGALGIVGGLATGMANLHSDGFPECECEQ